MRLTERARLARSMSSQRSPSASPRRKPVVAGDQSPEGRIAAIRGGVQQAGGLLSAPPARTHLLANKSAYSALSMGAVICCSGAIAIAFGITWIRMLRA